MEKIVMTSMFWVEAFYGFTRVSRPSPARNERSQSKTTVSTVGWNKAWIRTHDLPTTSPMRVLAGKYSRSGVICQ
jgi:hypothetical protein